MKQLSLLLEKEFQQVFRNPATLRSVFVMPIIQLIIFPFTANYEVKNVYLSMVDHDHTHKNLFQKLLPPAISFNRLLAILQQSNGVY